MDKAENEAISRAQELGILPMSAFPENPAYMKLLLSFIHTAPPDFVCKITKETMLDPVRCADGQIYERNAILKWWNENGTKSPNTNLELANTNLEEDVSLKKLIEMWKGYQHGGYSAYSSLDDLP